MYTCATTPRPKSRYKGSLPFAASSLQKTNNLYSPRRVCQKKKGRRQEQVEKPSEKFFWLVFSPHLVLEERNVLFVGVCW